VYYSKFLLQVVQFKLSRHVIARRNDEAIQKYLYNGLLRSVRNDVNDTLVSCLYIIVRAKITITVITMTTTTNKPSKSLLLVFIFFQIFIVFIF